MKRKKERKTHFHLRIVVAETSCSPKTMKNSTLKDVDEAASEWFLQKLAERVPISSPIISEKARNAAQLQKRHGIKH